MAVSATHRAHVKKTVNRRIRAVRLLLIPRVKLGVLELKPPINPITRQLLYYSPGRVWEALNDVRGSDLKSFHGLVYILSNDPRLPEHFDLVQRYNRLTQLYRDPMADYLCS